MSSPNRNEDDLRQREQELEAREQALRLRELEAEIYRSSAPEIPISPTTKYEKPEGKLRQYLRKGIKVAKFLGLIVAVVVAVKIGIWLATAVMVAGIAWVAYKIFFESSPRDR